MESGGGANVIDEVEALFKKLQDLPDGIRQKALSRIQQKLPNIDGTPTKDDHESASENSVDCPEEGKVITESPISKKKNAGKAAASPSKRKPPERGKKRAHSPERNVSGTVHLDADDAAELILEDIQTSRGRKTKRISVRGFAKTPKKHAKASVPAVAPSSSSSDTSNTISVVEAQSNQSSATKLKIDNVKSCLEEPSQTVVVDVTNMTAEILNEGETEGSVVKCDPTDTNDDSENIQEDENDLLNSKNAHRVQVHCLRDQTNNQEWYPVVTVDGATLDEVPCEEIMSIADAKIAQVKLEMEKQGLTQGTLPVDESCKRLSEIQQLNGTDSSNQVIITSVQHEDPDDENYDNEADDPSWEEDIADSSVNGEFNCQFCDFKGMSKLSLANHRRKHKENIPKPSFVCTECNKSFSQSCSLQLHLKRHRGERDFACPDCEYKAFTKVDLARHQTIHTGERNKICEYCGKAFAKDSTLRDHVKSIHERKLQHSCEMCGFVTHRANNLRVHIRMRHHGEYNNHVCPVCGASVKQKNAFLEHMRSHTGERPYKCSECTASFACTARLNVHRNSVHGERQFKCSDCDKNFQTKHHLLRHQAIHTKERPYACPFCSYACNTQGNIAKHVRSIHNRPDFSYRKYKDLIENGGRPREVDPEWVRKGEEVTKEYLNELSEKMGRPITLDELWQKEQDLQKRKQEQEKTRHAAREKKTLKAGALEHSYHTKPRRKRVVEKKASDGNDDCDDPQPQDENSEAAEGEVPVYGLLTNSGNIQLCMETNEVQVYTGDARRELPLLNAKSAGTSVDIDGVKTIQGYMNDKGQFIRCEDGVVVDEDDSTVVVIINSQEEEVNEALQNVDVEVLEDNDSRIVFEVSEENEETTEMEGYSEDNNYVVEISESTQDGEVIEEEYYDDQNIVEINGEEVVGENFDHKEGIQVVESIQSELIEGRGEKKKILKIRDLKLEPGVLKDHQYDKKVVQICEVIQENAVLDQQYVEIEGITEETVVDGENVVEISETIQEGEVVEECITTEEMKLHETGHAILQLSQQIPRHSL